MYLLCLHKMNEDELWNDLTLQLDTNSTNNNVHSIVTHEVCTSCSSSNITNHNGKYVCKECGNVFENIIDQGAEWRCFPSTGMDNTSIRCSDARSPFIPDTLSINT